MQADRVAVRVLFGSFLKLGVPFWGGLYNKDYSILGAILGSPYFGKLPFFFGFR